MDVLKKYCLLTFFILVHFLFCQNLRSQSALDLIDVDYPGLEEVKYYHSTNQDSIAFIALLNYYKTRDYLSFPGCQNLGENFSKEKREIADWGLEHRFQVMAGYKPPFFYGDDIDWQYWPVKDLELRWQLHRMPWWNVYARAYAFTKDEKYAKEWIYEYRDWIKKNPLNDYNPTKKSKMENLDNQYFAWRPLETGIRLKSQILQFYAMCASESFTSSFLDDFLVNYHKHMIHVKDFYTSSGNHRVTEAEGMVYAGLFFPEFKDSKMLQEQALCILNEELKNQVYEDGMQYELSPGYHYIILKSYLNVLKMCRMNNCRDANFLEIYDGIHSMIKVAKEFIYPDYSFNLFSDNQKIDSTSLKNDLSLWSEFFPQDSINPLNHSSAFSSSGFYFLKNGWDKNSTIVMVKAGPPAFYHCQPDNGTFEYWHKGRNFMPDSGCYIFSGDDDIKKQRDWFRQTKVHNTLTLNGKNLETTDSKLIEFKQNLDSTVLVVENQSYKDLKHRRKFVYKSDGSLLIHDIATGEAEGSIQIYYNLSEGDWILRNSNLTSRYIDGNNISVSVSSNLPLIVKREEGRISRTYKTFNERPSYSFNVDKKSNETVEFITVIKDL